MKTLGMILSSSGQMEVLRTLLCQPGPVGIREAARIAGVLPHGADHALRALCRRGLARRRRRGARVEYSADRRHPNLETLEAVFATATTGFIRDRARQLQPRAGQLTSLFASAKRMAERARSDRHEP